MSDYLQHWGLKKQSHKYIAKIGEGAKARYFYTVDELNAYKNAFKNQGATDRMNAATKTYNRAEATYKKDINTYNQAAKKHTEGVSLKSRLQNVNKQHEANKGKNMSVAEKLKKDYNAVTAKNANDRFKGAEQRFAAAKERNRQATVDYAKAQKKYKEETSLGGRLKNVKKAFDKRHPETAERINKGRAFLNKASDTISKEANTAKKAAKKAYNSDQAKEIRKAAGTLASEEGRKKKAKSMQNKAKNVSNRVQNEAKGYKDAVTGETAKQRYNQAKNQYKKDTAEYNKAKNRGAGDRTKDAFKSLLKTGSVKEAANAATNKSAEDKYNKARVQYKRRSNQYKQDNSIGGRLKDVKRNYKRYHY